MIRKFIRTLALVATLVVVMSSTTEVSACPSCKDANSTNPRLPLAYQASILFMLAVPTTLATTLGIMLYRLNKAQVLATQAFESGEVWYDSPETAEA